MKSDIPITGDLVPGWNRPAISRACRWILKRRGWTFVGEYPNLSKSVTIVAPHTSNWDFFVGLAAAFAVDLRASFIAKHTLFRGPVGWFLRRIGGVPVDRRKSQGLVEQMAAFLKEQNSIVLAITPEGTRKAVDRWKSGFYHIAALADVPIVLVAFDHATKRIGLGPVFERTGDVESDIREMRKHFDTFVERKPEAA